MANTMRSRVVAGAVACAMSIAPFAGTTGNDARDDARGDGGDRARR